MTPSLTPTVQKPSWLQRILGWLLPTTTLGFALILDAVPLVSGAWSLAVPSFLVPLLFFWSVQRPRSVPVLLVFALGLAADTIHNSPLGVHALSLMIVCLGAKSQSRQLAALGLIFNWIFFTLAVLSFAVLKFALSLLATPAALDQPLLPAILALLQLVLTTIIAYLPSHLLLSALNRLFLAPELASA